METEKKYKLTDESLNFCGRKLYRIEALRDFSDVKKGDKGGFVENERNLSQHGDCWIYDDAKVYGNATVCDNARVCEDALVSGNARIFVNANVFGTANIYGDARVFGESWVYGDANVFGNANVYGDARVYGDALICENARIFGNANVYGDARIFGESWVYDNAKVYGSAELFRDAKISSISDYIVFKNWWSSGRHFTWTRSNNMWKVGCFYGTGEELIKKAYKDSELSGREYEKAVKYVESILKDSNQ